MSHVCYFGIVGRFADPRKCSRDGMPQLEKFLVEREERELETCAALRQEQNSAQPSDSKPAARNPLLLNEAYEGRWYIGERIQGTTIDTQPVPSLEALRQTRATPEQVERVQVFWSTLPEDIRSHPAWSEFGEWMLHEAT
jgi:hypothetical protein